MSTHVKLKSRLIDIPRRNVLRLNQRLGRFDDVVWLIGDGRSGTTWISNLVNYDHRYRDVFEPFHPRRASGMEFVRPHLYLRPGDLDPPLRKAAGAVFSGRFTHPKTDAMNVRPWYAGMVVKDCSRTCSRRGSWNSSTTSGRC